GEGRAGALAAGDRDRAAVLLHDRPRAGEADAAARRPAARVGAAMEALEHVRKVGLGHADPFVLHAEHGDTAVGTALAPDAHADRAAVAVLHGVGEQVRDHPVEPGAVPVAAEFGLAALELDRM